MTNVLITRPSNDAVPFAAKCQDAGLTPILAPLFEISFDQDWTAPNNAAAFAFTSANGVRAFAKQRLPEDRRAYCVGGATALAAAEAGFLQIATANGDVGDLARLIAEKHEPALGEIIHLAGTKRAGDLIALLADKDIPASRIIAYATKDAATLPDAARNALDDGQPLAVTLFSPRTARLFLNLVAEDNRSDALQRCRAICLSNAVADIASDASWRRIETADKRSSAAMIAQIRARV